MKSGRVHLLVVLLIAIAALAGCATPPLPSPPSRAASPPAHSPPRVQRLADFATRPDGDPVHECIASTLRTQFGTFAMTSGMASDDKIAQALLGTLPEGPLRQQREVEIAVWRQTHDLTAMAQNHLDWCIQSTGVVVDSPPNLHTCLQGIEAVDVFVLAHAAGRSREVALAAARARYLGFLTDNELTLLSTHVFALTTENDDYRFRLTRLGQCLAKP